SSLVSLELIRSLLSPRSGWCAACIQVTPGGRSGACGFPLREAGQLEASGPVRSATLELILAAPTATHRLLLLNATQLALAHVPALAPDGAQNAALRDFLAEALEQRVLGLARA